MFADSIYHRIAVLLACFLLGLTVRQQIRDTGTLPLYFGIWMLISSLVSLLVLPGNGIWSIVIAGLIAISISWRPFQVSANVR